MAKSLKDWLETDIVELNDKPIDWLSEQYFFRDPNRAMYSDSSYFFPPADGIILYNLTIKADQPMVNIKGKSYSLQTAMRNESYTHPSLVIGIFMSFYDVHINRMPYAGRLTYTELDTIGSYNQPMLDVEKDILNNITPYTRNAHYLFHNQRIINRIFSMGLMQYYYILQIADYDIDCITPFRLKQNQTYTQNQRFSQIRYGSQVDLIIPLSDKYQFEALHNPGIHVESGIDPLVRITLKE